MSKQQIKLYNNFINKYGSFIDKQNLSDSYDELKDVLCELIHFAPFAVQTILKNKLFSKLYKFVLDETSFLPNTVSIGTRCWYLLNNRHEIIKCHNCGKDLIRNIKSTCHSEMFWCGPKCQGKDKYISNKISDIKLKNKRYSKRTKDNIPSECNIIYNSSPIEYDDNINAELFSYYEEHKKHFTYWIDQNLNLKKYLMEKSYPIDYTDLKIETRVKWVIDKLQRFPICKACGRKIDFLNVKMSGKWPEYCSNECRRSDQDIMSYNFHAIQIYNRIVSSEWTQPLFSFEDFKTTDRKISHFKLKCLKCNNEFSGRFDLNFYARHNHISYFRCPVCFPVIGKRKKSNGEIELFNYIKDTIGIDNVIRGDRTTIYPFELDIHPMNRFSDIAIEYNGVYWHSIEHGSDRNHILNKVKLCEKLGIKLITVWEDEFLADKKKIFAFVNDVFNNQKNIIDNLTGYGKKEIIEVDRSIFNKAWVFPGYELVGETPPSVIIRNTPNTKQIWTTPNAGTLIYKKI